MNTLKPPYVIKVVNTANLVPEVKEMVSDFSSAIAETRVRRLARIGEDVAVRLESKISPRPLRCGLEAWSIAFRALDLAQIRGPLEFKRSDIKFRGGIKSIFVCEIGPLHSEFSSRNTRGDGATSEIAALRADEQRDAMSADRHI